jgi:hypothetical protein
MSKYKDIRGTHITTVAADPPAPVNGQMWYNSTTQVMKGFTSNPVGSWSTTSTLNTARSALGGAGANTEAALAFGGSPPPAPTAKNNTESWNGSSWTEVNNLNEAKAYVAGAGTYTSAIAAGGDQYSGTAESWNGSSWTNITNEPGGGNAYGSAGADNEDALFFGGSPAGNTDDNRYWNGSSWTELGDLNTARSNLTGSGKTYTAALAIGGINSPSSYLANVESFDGTSWTETGDLNTGRAYLGADGTQTSALAWGGFSPPYTGATESWNGSAWTETGDLNDARSNMANGGAGPNSGAGLAYGGDTPGDTANSEEFVSPVTNTVTFTTS